MLLSLRYIIVTLILHQLKTPYSFSAFRCQQLAHNDSISIRSGVFKACFSIRMALDISECIDSNFFAQILALNHCSA